MMREGEEKDTRWNGVAYRSDSKSRAVWRLGGPTKDWLKEDFLLVSKLPIYSPQGVVLGTIVIAAGGHGAGTEAFRLLLEPDKFSGNELIWLYDKLRGRAFFQAVFRVAVEHNHSSRVTTPVGIEVVRDEHLEPVGIDPTADFFKRAPRV